MQPLIIQIAGVLTGAFVAVIVVLLTASNPSNIPFKRVALRAAFGLTLYFVMSAVLGLVVVVGIMNKVGIESHLAMFCASMLIAFGIPQLLRVKDIDVDLVTAKRYKFIIESIQYIDEITRLYLSRMYEREERKLCYEFFSGEDMWNEKCAAVDRLFEFHSIEIVRRQAQRSQEKKKSDIFSLFRLRARQVKLKYLFRFLGSHYALIHLEHVAEKPLSLFPAWRDPTICRRQKNNSSDGRRKYESEYVRAYVIGS